MKIPLPGEKSPGAVAVGAAAALGGRWGWVGAGWAGMGVGCRNVAVGGGW